MSFKITKTQDPSQKTQAIPCKRIVLLIGIHQIVNQVFN